MRACQVRPKAAPTQMIDRSSIFVLGGRALGEESPAARCDSPRRVRHAKLRARMYAPERTACQLEVACSVGGFHKLGAGKGVHEQLLGVLAGCLQGGRNRVLIL